MAGEKKEKRSTAKSKRTNGEQPSVIDGWVCVQDTSIQCLWWGGQDADQRGPSRVVASRATLM